jgi:hypothetical protein
MEEKSFTPIKKKLEIASVAFYEIKLVLSAILLIKARNRQMLKSIYMAAYKYLGGHELYCLFSMYLDANLNPFKLSQNDLFFLWGVIRNCGEELDDPILKSIFVPSEWR